MDLMSVNEILLSDDVPEGYALVAAVALLDGTVTLIVNDGYASSIISEKGGVDAQEL